MSIVQPLTETLKFNDFILRVATTGLDDETARRRSRGDSGSSIAWNLGHLLHNRGLFARVIQCEGPALEVDRFGAGAATDGHDYPTIAELQFAWHELSTRLIEATQRLTTDDVSRPAPTALAHGEKTVLDALVFHAWHESYHVGHIGMLRSHFGLTPIATLVTAGAASAAPR